MAGSKEREQPEGTQHPAKTVLEQVLAQKPRTRQDRPGPSFGDLREADVATWRDDAGTLAEGGSALLGPSCLVRPRPGDRVLVWHSYRGSSHVLAVIERHDADAPAVLGASTPLSIQAPSVAVASETLHIQCEDMLTYARNRHAVEDTRTETARVRVAQVGTDIRRATTVSDEVSGTLVQKIGTWLSSTVRDARLKARTFLFD